ncbi:Endoplasmic reticulum aminopeptidase 1, partial [Desmophyllum pertusum]
MPYGEQSRVWSSKPSWTRGTFQIGISCGAQSNALVDSGKATSTQKHFLLDPNANVTVKSPFNYKWYVPLTYVFQDSPQNPKTTWMNMTDKGLTATVCHRHNNNYCSQALHALCTLDNYVAQNPNSCNLNPQSEHKPATPNPKPHPKPVGLTDLVGLDRFKEFIDFLVFVGFKYQDFIIKLEKSGPVLPSLLSLHGLQRSGSKETLKQVGYYRVHYDDDNWNALIKQLKDDLT